MLDVDAILDLEVCKLKSEAASGALFQLETYFNWSANNVEWTNEVNNVLLFHMFFRSEPPSSPEQKSETELGWELFEKWCGPKALVELCSRDSDGPDERLKLRTRSQLV